MRKSYLLNSTATFEAPNDKGVDAEAARKAAVEETRKAIKVESVKIEDEPEDSSEQKDEDSEEKEKEDGDEEEASETDGDKDKVEDEDKEEDKEAIRARKKQERIDRKLDKQREELKALKKENDDLKAKLSADPEKGNRLTEEDVETRAKKKADEQRIKDRFDETADKLADNAQKHLKLTNKKFETLIEGFREEVGDFPPSMIVALGKIKNGAETLAHLLQNHDEAEDIIKLAKDPIEMTLELNALATKLKPKQKAVSQVPDPVEPLGGKSKGNNGDFRQKDISMDEYVQRRNADIAAKRENGRRSLR